MIGAVDPWSWQPHPEVWVLIAGIIGLGFYTTRVIGPKVVASGAVDSGAEVVTTTQKRYFALGVVALAIAADWPMHDIAEEYLYSVHMLQHMLITFFIPILFLQATPEWLARLIIRSDTTAAEGLRRLAKPVAAGLIFNFLAAITHWNGVVQLSADSGAFHYGIHLAMFASALLMWLPVLGPLPELRLSPPTQMIYLFLMSIIPTIPAGWLTFADNPVYPAYDTPVRLWGISVVDDQQAAGFVMKVLGGFFLWVLIAVRFFRWSAEERRSDMDKRVVRPLTYEAVSEEFERTEPAPEPR